MALIRGETLREVLMSYKTSTNYLDLWHGEKGLPMPGAGDSKYFLLSISSPSSLLFQVPERIY